MTAPQLENKVALITGAASGIGKATALLFAAEGATVGLADIDPGMAQSVVQQTDCPSTHCVIPLDVTKEEQWSAAIQQIESHCGPPDILINSAGIAEEAPIVDLPLDQWHRVFSVNLDGAFLGMQAAIRAMASRRTGSIVNVSSLSGIKASAGAAAYCSSKAALIQLTKVGALECASQGLSIRVNAIAPGGVKTPMWEKTPLWPDISTSDSWTAPVTAPPLNRFAEPYEVAQVILFLASDAASYISGAVLPIDGGGSA